jgi:hypothetical protein
VTCPLRQDFSVLSQKQHDFYKKVIGHEMCVLILYTTVFRNISHSKKNLGRYDKKCVLVFMYSTRYSGRILIKLEFSRQIFQKYSNFKFHENPLGGSGVPCGRREMTIVACRSFANAPKNNVRESYIKELAGTTL